MEFEKKLEALEKIVEKLEAKDVPLEEGIRLYEDGLSLTKECIKALSESKGKISVVKKEMDKLIESPLGDGAED
ncbi:MAG: exodeoxyribonuclease VII small subunit [Clostridiales bacterium]|jgi:exodeoxyribonuclease VII small subunit|nr:exodeoxyribonuclease VII small subunit [Clostridiales bacterium]